MEYLIILKFYNNDIVPVRVMADNQVKAFRIALDYCNKKNRYPMEMTAVPMYTKLVVLGNTETED